MSTILMFISHLFRMFSYFYPQFLNLRIRSNDISQVLNIDQEISFDQFQFILVVFLVFSFVFICCVSIFLESLLHWILSPVSILYRNYHSITKNSRVNSCHSLILTWECKQTWLLLNFVPTIDFTSSQHPAHGKLQFRQTIIQPLFVFENFSEIPQLKNDFYFLNLQRITWIYEMACGMNWVNGINLWIIGFLEKTIVERT